MKKKYFLTLLALIVVQVGKINAQENVDALFSRAAQQYSLFESERDSGGAKSMMYDNLYSAYSSYEKILKSDAAKKYADQIAQKLKVIYPNLLAGGVYFSEQHNNAKALNFVSAYIDIPKLPVFRSDYLQRDERYAKILHYAGVTAYNLGKYDDAIIYFQEFLGTGSEESLKDIYVYLNMIYAAKENYVAQEQILKQAIVKFPVSVDFLYSLVNVYISTKNMTNLLATIDKITAIDPNDMKILPIKARMMESQGRNREALDVYKRIYAISPSAEVYAGIARTNYNIASDIVNSANNIADNTEYAIKKQEAMPYLRDARDQFTDILQQNPTSKQFMVGMVGIYANMDMTDEATVLNSIIEEGGDYSMFNARLLAYNKTKRAMGNQNSSVGNNDTPVPTAPARLKTTLKTIEDDNDNNLIDAGETIAFTFDVTNDGRGEAYNLRIRLAEDKGLDRFLDGPREIDGGHLMPGETKTYTLRYIVDKNIPTELAKFNFYVFEGNGFDADPAELVINTQEYEMPRLVLSDYQFFAGKGSAISLGDDGKLSVVVQNRGAVAATNVRVAFQLPENVFAQDVSERVIDTLAAGDAIKLDYSFVVNKRFDKDSIAVLFSAEESLRISFVNEALKVKVGEYLSASSSMRVEGDITRRKVDLNEIKLSYRSELLNNVPIGIQKPNRYALIIGNEDYSMTGANAEINVPYAINDAIVFKEYCLRTFGIPEDHIKLIPNATAGMMHEQLDWLVNIAASNPDAELFFYYSGHGNNDEKTKVPYLIPVDITGRNIRLGIALDDLYAKLATNYVRGAYVFLDACFSGGYKSSAPLIAQKGVRVAPKSGVPQGNTIVISSSSGDQTSSVYDDKKHGYYTYFLIKAIQDADGDLTMAELIDRTTVGVKKATAILGKPQDPGYMVSPAMGDDWQLLRLKD
ncbi:MAG: caspase family protein [Rikenellaceae bacterium]